MNTQFSNRKSLLYGAIVTVLMLLLFESVARVAESVKPSGAVGEKMIPPKQRDHFRIFVYGGSTVQGLPVSAYGFVPQLEFWLKESHPEKRLEIYNFGRAGANSAYVRRVVTESISHNPDLLIVLSGHNEFLPSRIYGQPDKILDSVALTRVLARIVNKIRATYFSAPKNIVAPNYEEYARGSDLFNDKVSEYVENIGFIAETAKKNDKPLLLLTAASNVSDWPPADKRAFVNSDEEWNRSEAAQVVDIFADEHSDRQFGSSSEILPTNAADPMQLYLYAKAHAVVGDYDRAKMLFTKAKDLDPVPWRALTEFNQALRKLAELDRVILIDVETSFQRHALHGLVGFSLFADNCHPTPLGNAIISREILLAMRRNGLFVEKDIGLIDIDSSLEHYMLTTTTLDKRRSLELQYLLGNAKYSMKTPFYNFEASRMYLDRALDLDSSKWEIWVNLATLSLFENRIEEGRQQLGKAIQLRGLMVDENDRHNAPNLKEALEYSGVHLSEFR